jgi:hypothetical protein
MATTKITEDGTPPTRDRTEIARIIALVEDSGPTRRDRVAHLSAVVNGVVVLEIVFGREDQRIAWRAFERLVESGSQDVQIRSDEHGWTVRVGVALDAPDAACRMAEVDRG